MHIVITKKEMFDLGCFAGVVRLKQWDKYSIPNMRDDDEIELSIKEAKELGII